MDPQEGATWKDTYDVWIDALESNYREVIEGAAGFVPNLISAAILLVVGWLLATGLRFLILRFGTRLDRLFQVARDRLGPAQGELRWPISRMLAFVVYWLVIVFFLAVVSETLGLPGLSDAFDEILIHLPILLICAVVLFVVYLLSGVAANAVATAARSSGVSNSRLLGARGQSAHHDAGRDRRDQPAWHRSHAARQHRDHHRGDDAGRPRRGLRHRRRRRRGQRPLPLTTCARPTASASAWQWAPSKAKSWRSPATP